MLDLGTTCSCFLIWRESSSGVVQQGFESLRLQNSFGRAELQMAVLKADEQASTVCGLTTHLA